MSGTSKPTPKPERPAGSAMSNIPTRAETGRTYLPSTQRGRLAPPPTPAPSDKSLPEPAADPRTGPVVPADGPSPDDDSDFLAEYDHASALSAPASAGGPDFGIDKFLLPEPSATGGYGDLGEKYALPSVPGDTRQSLADLEAKDIIYDSDMRDMVRYLGDAMQEIERLRDRLAGVEKALNKPRQERANPQRKSETGGLAPWQWISAAGLGILLFAGLAMLHSSMRTATIGGCIGFVVVMVAWLLVDASTSGRRGQSVDPDKYDSYLDPKLFPAPSTSSVPASRVASVAGDDGWIGDITFKRD